jgi:hypothetical protein
MDIPENILIVTPAVQTRNRDVLSPTAAESRYRGKSEKGNYYLKTRGVEITAEKAVSNHFRAKNASDGSRDNNLADSLVTLVHSKSKNIFE